MAGYLDLDVYKSSYQLALDIHVLSLKLPKYLQFDLADQIRRASRSIPSNIAEGYSRGQSKQEVVHYLRMALGSSSEMLFNLGFMKDSDLLDEETHTLLIQRYTILGKQLTKLRQSLNQQTNKPTN